MKWCVRRMVFAMLRLGATLGDRDQLAEGLGVANRQVREHLAIDVDPGQLQSVHELVVRHPLAARGGVDPRDPQLAHVPLAGTPVAIGIFERMEHGLVRRPEQGPVRHPEPLGEVEDLLVAPPGGDAALYPRHLTLSPSGTAPPGAAAERPYRSEPAACCTGASDGDSCVPTGDSSARAGA